MKIPVAISSALATSIAAALLAACGGSRQSIGAPPNPLPAGQMLARTHSGVTYHELHVFSGSPGDGAKPVANLIDVNGTLYRTTANGGAYNQGTVFAITLSGSLTVLHNFTGAPDGAGPYARLADGTLFALTPGSQFTSEP